MRRRRKASIAIAGATLVALTALTSASASAADCRTIAFNMHPSQNETISTTGTSTGGGACIHRYRSWASFQFNSGSIVSPASNGSLSEIGALQFRYRPKAGFKGVDHYTVRVCGTGVAGSGCSTINYAITVQ